MHAAILANVYLKSRYLETAEPKPGIVRSYQMKVVRQYFHQFFKHNRRAGKPVQQQQSWVLPVTSLTVKYVYPVYGNVFVEYHRI